MRRVFSTARMRLALVFMGLFAVAGAALVALTYFLVAANVRASDVTLPPNYEQFVKTCTKLGAGGAPVDANLKAKCQILLSHSSAAFAAVQRADMLQTLATDALIALAVLTVVSGLVGWFVAGRILRPVSRITAAARAAGEGDLSARLALRGPHDELRELADTFDGMLDRLEAAFSAQKRFIANASHELRTPLTVIRTTVDVVLARSSASVGDLRRMGEDVRAETQHADALIDALLTLTRSDGIVQNTEAVPVGDLTRQVVDGLRTDDVSIDVTTSPGVVDGDPSLIERLVGNLVDNAIRYSGHGGTVAVSVSGDGEQVVLRVTNGGGTVPPDQLERLFQPFTRLDDRTGEGFGLGLSIVQSIAHAHGATVDALAPETGGLDVTVTFPRSPEPVAAESGSAASAG
jgi:signal transduction histidine kinase